MSRDLEKENKVLERKAKAGWKMYFDLKEEFVELIDYMIFLREKNKTLMNNKNNNDISFLTAQFKDMYDELKKKSDCPICFEPITKENMNITNCGHIFCKECSVKLSNCAVCRKFIYKK